VSSGGGITHLETERKFDAGPALVLPDFTGLPGVAAVSAATTQRLTAVYFDTAGLRLAAARITLRRRTGGQDAGWHLKLPVGGDTRREVRLPPGRAAGPVPAELAGLVAPWTRGEALRPVARLKTTRLVRHLTGSAGEVLAEVADDRVAASRARPVPALPPGDDRAAAESAWQEPLRWREIEVELAAGAPPGLLDAAARRLAAAGAAQARSSSKLQRLLGPAAVSGDDTGAGGR
jgi:inorganic triphosphatase YgiF